MDPKDRDALWAKFNTEWDKALNSLFQNQIPTSFSWQKQSDIIRVLSHMAKAPNHMFLPYGGGLDLEDAGPGNEKDTIDLHTAGKHSCRVKPEILQFCHIPNTNSSFFYLSCQPLAVTGIYDDYDDTVPVEEVIEIAPAKYRQRHVWDQGFLDYDQNGDEIPLPSDSKIISRYKTGAFALFSKGSEYNTTSVFDIYGAHHEKSGFAKFCSEVSTVFTRPKP